MSEHVRGQCGGAYIECVRCGVYVCECPDDCATADARAVHCPGAAAPDTYPDSIGNPYRAGGA